MSPQRWRLGGKTALVTGASRGIGLACARELLGLGADVLMVARDPEHLEALRLELEEQFPAREVRACAADLADAEQRLEVFDWIADTPRAGGNPVQHAVMFVAARCIDSQQCR